MLALAIAQKERAIFQKALGVRPEIVEARPCGGLTLWWHYMWWPDSEVALLCGSLTQWWLYIVVT